MRIDVSGIENYEAMTAEEKVAALESFEFEQEDVSRLKTAVDRATHEAADYKKQLKAFQDQQKNGSDELKNLQDQIAELKREKMLSDLTAQYTALGYDADLAKATATAYADGDTETVFANQKAFNESREKALKAEILKQTPRPGKGGTGEPGTGMTLKKLREMDPLERKEWAASHQDEYRRLYGG